MHFVGSAAYRNEVVESIKRQRMQYELFLKEVPLFASMSATQRAKVADALRAKSYAAGQLIIKQVWLPLTTRASLDQKLMRTHV